VRGLIASGRLPESRAFLANRRGNPYHGPAPQTTTWLDRDTDLRSANNCAGPVVECMARSMTARFPEFNEIGAVIDVTEPRPHAGGVQGR
jgi:hypothetical protein